MADKVGEIYIDMDLKTDKVHSGLNQVENKASGVTSSINTGFKNTAVGVAIGTMAVQGIEMAFSALKNTVVDAFSQYAEGARTQAQLQAVLRSTAGVAGVTADEVNNLAEEIMNMSGIDDEAVVSAQSLLLTFTAIGKDIFPDATRSAIDMAVALNGGLTPSAEDLQSKIILVGKALQDPDAGLGALKRVGVNVDELSKKFNDSMTVQEKQILILKELNTEFGGSAKAMGETVPGKIDILKEKFNNLKQDLAGKFIVIVEQLLKKFEEWWSTAKIYVIPALLTIKDNFMALGRELINFYNKNKDWLLPLMQYMAIILGVTLLIAIQTIIYAIRLLIAVFDWVAEKIRIFNTVLTNTYKIIADGAITIYTTTLAVWNYVTTTFDNIRIIIAITFLNIYNTIIGIINSIINRFWTLYNGAVNSVSSMRNTIAGIFGSIYGTMVGYVNGAVSSISGMIGWISGRFWAIYGAVAGAMGSVYWAIRGPFEAVFNWLSGKINWIRSELSKLDPLKRFSPSLLDRITYGTDKIKQQYGSLFDTIGEGANSSRGDLNKLVTNNQNNNTNNSTSSVNFYAPINLADNTAVDAFFNKLNRNNELARKGMAIN